MEMEKEKETKNILETSEAYQVVKEMLLYGTLQRSLIALAEFYLATDPTMIKKYKLNLKFYAGDESIEEGRPSVIGIGGVVRWSKIKEDFTDRAICIPDYIGANRPEILDLVDRKAPYREDGLIIFNSDEGNAALCGWVSEKTRKNYLELESRVLSFGRDRIKSLGWEKCNKYPQIKNLLQEYDKLVDEEIRDNVSCGSEWILRDILKLVKSQKELKSILFC